jgi:hypothetical protein
MANRPDPNNPQPGDVFFNLDGDKRTIINRLGDWCWVNCHDGYNPVTFDIPMIAKDYKPAPPTPPDMWGAMADEGQVITYTTQDNAERYIGRHGGVLVHYVGTVVEP